MEKQNRAERRKNKFGGGRATEHGGWPTHQPNPVFGTETDDAAPASEPPADPPVPAQPKKSRTKAPAPEADATGD